MVDMRIAIVLAVGLAPPGCGRTQIAPPFAIADGGAPDGGSSDGGGDRIGDAPVDRGAPTVVQLALGAAFSCARLSDGTVMCWGFDGDGQLGVDPERCPGATITRVPDLAGVASVAAGLGHACAALDDGRV